MMQSERAPSLPSRADSAVPERAAHAHTRRLARGHYENFPVLSMLLPRRLRQDFANVYAYCRGADDLADEPRPPAERRAALRAWRAELHACFAGQPATPVFVALRTTIERHDLPLQPFAQLLDAFEQDQTITRYESWPELLSYCQGSANPVGRIVLRLCGHHHPAMDELSDATCTALQLVNFWQDVRQDVLERDRVYLPRAIAKSHGLDLERLVLAIQDAHRTASPIDADLLAAYVATVCDLCARTRPLFQRGRDLWPRLGRDVRPVIQLFTLGGEAILRAIERSGYRTLERRPRLSALGKGALLARACWAKWLAPS